MSAPLVAAATKGDQDELRTMLVQGTDVNQQNKVSDCKNIGLLINVLAAHILLYYIAIVCGLSDVKPSVWYRLPCWHSPH